MGYQDYVVNGHVEKHEMFGLVKWDGLGQLAGTTRYTKLGNRRSSVDVG